MKKWLHSQPCSTTEVLGSTVENGNWLFPYLLAGRTTSMSFHDNIIVFSIVVDGIVFCPHISLFILVQQMYR